MSQIFDHTWEIMWFITRFLLPLLLHAGYCVKIKKKHLPISIININCVLDHFVRSLHRTLLAHIRHYIITNKGSPIPIIIISVLDLPVSESQFPHPVHSTTHSGRTQPSIGGSAGMKTIWSKVIGGEILTIVICCYCVYVFLVTVLEEK